MPTSLKVWVDEDACTCNAACEGIAPEVFVVGDRLFPRVRVAGTLVDATHERPAILPSSLGDAVMRGVRYCPMGAIHALADEEV